MKVVLRLTRSQHMALSSILVSYARLENEPQEFVDIVEEQTTTLGELLELVIPLNEVELTPADRQWGRIYGNQTQDNPNPQGN